MANSTTFKKGQMPWNKGIPMSDEAKDKQRLVQVGKKRHTEISKSQIGKASKGNKYALGYKHTNEALKKISKPGEKHPNWRGEKVGYMGIHRWLQKTFGKALRCENKSCLKNRNQYEWAKLEDKNYERKRENFIELCTMCHRRYDRKIIKIIL